MNTLPLHQPKLLPAQNGQHLQTNRPAPFIQLIHHFQPRTQSKKLLEDQLKAMEAQIEKALMKEYTSEKVIPVLQRLRGIIKDLNYHTHKNSIALFVTADQEKILYLDQEVDNRFSTHPEHNGIELAQSKRKDPRYLVVQLSTNRSQTYLGEGNHLQLIKDNTGDEFTANKAFLQHMAYGLSVLLQSYPYPVFLVGKTDILQAFCQLSENSTQIAACIHSERQLEADLKGLLNPYLLHWETVTEKIALAKMAQAKAEGQLKNGFVQVEQSAGRRHGQLLLCEKGYDFGNWGNHTLPFYANDALDHVMVKVLEAGGNIVFTQPGTLSAHSGIVLINPGSKR